MIKKLLSSFLVIVMMLSYISVSAITELPLTYTPGETHYIVDASDVIATEHAFVDSDSVLLEKGGSATFGFYLPYSSRSLTIKYSGSGNIAIHSGENVYTAQLTNNGEYLLEFGENLGLEKQMYRYNNDDISGFLREYVEHRGEKEVKITTIDNSITINQLLFEKEKTPSQTTKLLPNVSTEVLETVNTVFIDTKAPVIVVNGGKRYIDSDDISMVPFNYNGSVYLPINTLAKALGYYHEENPETGYALMRSESHEVVMMGDVCTVSKGLSEKVQTPDNVFIYRNGETLAAVRYFAELLGKTVAFKDGLIVIDDKYTVQDVLTKQSYLTYATNKFAPFKEEAKSGKTYYVAQTSIANDNNTGTVFAPFKTLAKAAEVAKAGDTVIIREGIYRETLMPKNSGTATAPITFCAAEGEKVVISANDQLGTLVKYEDDVYVTKMPVDLGDGRNQIFIDDVMQTEARYPNGPSVLHEQGRLSNAWPTRGNLYRPLSQVGEEAYDHVYSDTLLNQEDDYWAGATYVGLISYAYAVVSAKITSSTKGQLTLDKKNRTDRTHWWSQNYPHNRYNYGYIVGHEHALDVPGEWIRTEEGTLKIVLPEGTDHTKVKIEAKARQLVIDLANKKFINVEGIKTIGGSARMNNSEMCMLKNMDMKYITHYTISADSRNGYITFPFSTAVEGAPQRGEVGIFISGTDNMIIDSVIDHSAGAAVYLVGTYTYIENNVINDCGYMGSYVSGIHMDSQAWDSITKARGGHAIYNNSVNNAGRSVLNIQALGSHGFAPYLPMEIAYNRFSNGTLMSADTATVYTYGVNVGIDKRRTEMHHNYVFKSTTEADTAYFNWGIYWDGQSHGSDTYQNVVFHTGKNSPIYHAGVYMQHLNEVQAWHRIWGNHQLGYVAEGENNLQAAYFGEGKPFNAGSSLNQPDFDLNYEIFNRESNGIVHTALGARVSEGVTVSEEDGYATFTGNGQWIDFGEVDFGTVSNEIALNVYGDSNYTYDEIEIVIDNDETSTYKTTIAASSPDLNDVHTKRIVIGSKSGKHNVKIKVNDYRSVRIGGISVYNHEAEFLNDNFAQFSYAGGYNARNKLATHEENKEFALWHVDTAGYNGASPALKSTWPGNYLRYDKQVISDDATHMVFSIGSRGDYRREKVTVYLDSLDSEPVGEFIVTKKQFFDYTPTIVELNKKVEAGTYDVYLVFTDDTSDVSGSTNFLYFGFLKEGADLSDYKVRVREYGEYFDEALSIQNAERPFHKLFVNSGPYHRHAGILYTLPGTKAVYTDVDIPDGCTHLYLDYATDAAYAGQPIEIYLKNNDNNDKEKLIATVVSEERTFDDDLVCTQLLSEIPAGNYTVSLNFGGDADSEQTMQMNWFGFGVSE